MSGGSRERRLIINADDFGWSRSVNRGIIETHTNGIVTSASILAAGTDFENAVELARATPSLGLGVHLNFYRGTPVLPPERVRSLIGEDGRFLGSWEAIVGRLATGRFDLAELEAELRAAITLVQSVGITPTHLNSEKHLHLWPSAFQVVAKLAEEFAIPCVRVVREPFSVSPIPQALTALSAIDARVARTRGVATPDATIGVTEAPTTLAALERLLAKPAGHDVELVVHPGHVDEEFREIGRTLPNRLECSREEELAVLTSAEARELVDRSEYQLVRSLCGPAA